MLDPTPQVLATCLQHARFGSCVGGALFWMLATPAYPDYDGFTLYCQAPGSMEVMAPQGGQQGGQPNGAAVRTATTGGNTNSETSPWVPPWLRKAVKPLAVLGPPVVPLPRGPRHSSGGAAPPAGPDADGGRAPAAVAGPLPHAGLDPTGLHVQPQPPQPPQPLPASPAAGGGLPAAAAGALSNNAYTLQVVREYASQFSRLCVRQQGALGYLPSGDMLRHVPVLLLQPPPAAVHQGAGSSGPAASDVEEGVIGLLTGPGAGPGVEAAGVMSPGDPWKSTTASQRVPGSEGSASPCAGGTDRAASGRHGGPAGVDEAGVKAALAVPAGSKGSRGRRHGAGVAGAVAQLRHVLAPCFMGAAAPQQHP